MSIKHNFPGPSILDCVTLGRNESRHVKFHLYRFEDGDTAIGVETGAMMIQLVATREQLEAMRDAINSAIEQDIADEVEVV